MSIHRSRRFVAIVAIVMAWTLATTSGAGAITGDVTGINIIAPTGRSITGTIKGADTNAVITKASVSAYSSDYSSYGYASVNSSGVFTIRGLKPNLQYSISVSPSDDIHYGGCYTTANANHFINPCPYPYPLTASLTTSTLNVGVIKVPKGAKISGTVKGGTTGSNVAVGGVEVNVSGTTAGAGYGWATSSGTGYWSVPALPPGTYNVSYTTPSEVNYRDGQWKSNGGTNWVNAAATPGNIVLGSANKTANVILPTGYVVQGYIKNTAGSAGVQYVSVDLECQSAACVGDSESTSTDATGHYVLKGLPGGTYQMSIDTYAYNAATNFQDGMYTTSVASHFKNVADAGSNIAVSANKTLSVVKLPAGFRILGTVKNPAGSAGLSGVYVSASGVAGAASNSGGTSTSSTGAFTIYGLNPGTYNVSVNPYGTNYYGGYFDAGTATYRLNLDETAADTKALSASVPSWNIGTVRVRQAFKLSGTIWGGTVASHVAIAGASVYASKTVAPYASGYATTAANGTYTIQGLPPGDYRVSYYVPSGKNYRNGYYKAGAASGRNWVEMSSQAGLVHVGP